MTIQDSWLEGPMVISMRQSAGNEMALLEAVVTLGEVGTVRYPDSAGIHYFLAGLYLDLPEELSPKVKESMEIEKLRVEGKTHIWDMPRDSETIIENMGPDPTLLQGIHAAADYMHSWGAHVYASSNNVQRAVSNLNDAIQKSRANPDLYRDLMNVHSALFLFDERTYPYLWTTAIHLSPHKSSGDVAEAD